MLEVLAVDLIVIANVSVVPSPMMRIYPVDVGSPSASAQDLLSYNKEQAVGDDEHNIVTVIMKQFQVGVQQAIDKAGELSHEKMEKFCALYQHLPRWVGPVDLDVQKLVDGMAQCVSGVLHWSYESQRYFGTRGLEVKRTRMVHLLPRMKAIGGGGGVRLGPGPCPCP
jgi:hypothetical protein